MGIFIKSIPNPIKLSIDIKTGYKSKIPPVIKWVLFLLKLINTHGNKYRICKSVWSFIEKKHLFIGKYSNFFYHYGC